MGCSRCSSYAPNRTAISNNSFDSFGPSSVPGFKQTKPAGAMALPSQFSSYPWGPAIAPLVPVGPSVKFVTGWQALQMMGHTIEDWAVLTENMRMMLLSRLNNKLYYVGPFPMIPNLHMQAGVLDDLFYQTRKF